MYKEYMEENSNQFIHFQTDIVDSIWNTIQADYKGNVDKKKGKRMRL